jgi:hypothetical protein
MTISVTEKWDYPHTVEQRRPFHWLLREMYENGRMFPASTDPEAWSYSTYAEDGSPTKIFIDLAAAQEYINFIANLNPVSITLTFNK